MKQNTMFKALVIREIKHFTSNAMVMLNGAMGIILCIIAAGAVLIYQDEIQMIASIPQIQEYMTPVLCLMVIAVSSLNMISASSISLEGDRFWIIKSLPITTQDI